MTKIDANSNLAYSQVNSKTEGDFFHDPAECIEKNRGGRILTTIYKNHFRYLCGECKAEWRSKEPLERVENE